MHHGPSAEGNDHLHLVVNIVRADGRLAHLYLDWLRWRTWCRQVEDRDGLTRTAPAGEGRAEATTRPELERAARAGVRTGGRVQTDREQLRRLVDAAATTANSEPEFVALLRHAGVLAAAHLVGGRVTGYAVALAPERSTGGAGSAPYWVAGSALRRDLSLPRVRARWHDRPPLPDAHAVRVWTGEWSVPPASTSRRHHTWRSVTRLMEQAHAALRDELASVAGDAVAWHQAVERAAGLVGVLARADPTPSTPPACPSTTTPNGAAPLARVHDQLTRAAQLPRGRRPPARPGGAVALLTRAARVAAISTTPAASVARIVLALLHRIAVTLAALADRLAVRAAARQQIRRAVRELAAHPTLAAATAPGARVDRPAAAPTVARRQPGRVGDPAHRALPVRPPAARRPAPPPTPGAPTR